MNAYLVYRINDPVTVAVQKGEHYSLEQVPAGCLFRTANSTPDCNGMISGVCRGDAVLMFSRDLEDCAIAVGTEAAFCVNLPA